MAAHHESLSVSNCAISFDEDCFSFFAFKEHELSSDVVEGKTLAAKAAGHNPRTEGFAKRPWAQPTPQKQCQNLMRAQRRIVRLDNDGLLSDAHV